MLEVVEVGPLLICRQQCTASAGAPRFGPFWVAALFHWNMKLHDDSFEKKGFAILIERGGVIQQSSDITGCFEHTQKNLCSKLADCFSRFQEG